MGIMIGPPVTRTGKTTMGGKTLVLFVPAGERPYRRWGLFCAGPKRHYQKDGHCAHTKAVIDCMRSDWHRSRTWLTPFGDNTAAEVRAWHRDARVEAA